VWAMYDEFLCACVHVHAYACVRACVRVWVDARACVD
jgi:hypothetical protein